ncbi:dioxygenase family protein [Povalibacter sp.]|uniref:dioxygenase family protein n=1 Tax=Povalibacter sp. TaxID=1962978 RepID=UPI0032C2172B
MSVTPSQTVGPYFEIGLIHERWNRLCTGEGQRLTIAGSVLDAAGQPVTDAMLEIWQPDRRAFGRFRTDPASGEFRFDVMRPVSLRCGSGAAPVRRRVRSVGC